MKNWQKVAVSEILGIVLFVAVPQPSLAQCRPTKKQRAVSAGIIAGFGALIGSAIAQNRGRGALIGAGVGAAIGAVGARDMGCVAQERGRAQEAQQRYEAPYNGTIAPASAPEPADGPTVVIRNVNGADEQLLEPILGQALAHQGYALMDRSAYYQNRAAVDYLLDVTVRQVNGANGWNGGGFSINSFSNYGNRAVGGGTYQVSLSMIRSDGRLDPTRSATKDVQSVTYADGNGYVTISRLYGYGSHSYYTSDPQTGAAEEAINDFFGLR